MSTKTFIRVEGLKECEEALAELKATFGLSTATARNIVSRALKYAAIPMANAASAKAPVGDRKRFSKRLGRVLTPGKLKPIRIGTRTTPTQQKKTPKESPVEVYVGPAAWPHAHLVEYGTAHAAPKSFLRSAADSNIGNVTARFRSRLKEEIEKAAARARSKAARSLAKSK